jgi:hypothetical protein
LFYTSGIESSTTSVTKNSRQPRCSRDTACAAGEGAAVDSMGVVPFAFRRRPQATLEQFETVCHSAFGVCAGGLLGSCAASPPLLPASVSIIILLVLLLHHCASLGRHWLPCACLAAALSLIGSLNQISRVRRIFTVARANTSSLNYCPRGCTKVMALEPTLPDTQRFA